MNVLINAANVLLILGYSTTDMLRLRLLSVVATFCVVIYFFKQPEPLVSVAVWTSIFLLLNLVQVAQLLRSRWPRGGKGWRGTVTP